MSQDLFIPKKSKREQVYDFIKSKGRARTSEVCAFGISIYHPDRASRDARDLAKEGRIWRMRDDIKLFIYGKTKEDIWSVYESDKEYDPT